MTKDSLFKLLVPTRFRATCRGAKRAERRRALRTDDRWMNANLKAQPFRQKKLERNLEAMRQAAVMWAARQAIIRKLFGGKAAA